MSFLRLIRDRAVQQFAENLKEKTPLSETISTSKPPGSSDKKPSISRAMFEEIILASAKLDYLKEDIRGIKTLHADHETRMRRLEDAESKRQGGSGMAAFLYGAVWPAATVIISAIALYLTHQPS